VSLESSRVRSALSLLSSVLETLARLLLATNYQTTHAGDRAGISLLFDMNLLFEKYVAALTRQAYLSSGYKLQTQGPQRCLVRDQNDQSLFHTKPDMHLHCGEDIVVLDTKWKRLDQAQANLGITQTDIYQMHGYEQIYKSQICRIGLPTFARDAQFRPSKRLALRRKSCRLQSGDNRFLETGRIRQHHRPAHKSRN
jgi:5-methylcytosine-specific restriction endonuclease McrBC regulatory subunit McrC